MMPKSFEQWPKLGVWLPVLLLVGYGALLAGAGVAGFPAGVDDWSSMPFLSVQPVGEDGFYFLATAWNLAAGRGLSADGMTATTGIQPLVPILLAIPAKIIQWTGGSKWDLVRVVIVFGTVNLAVFAGLAARVAEELVDAVDGRVAFGVFALTATSYPLFRLFTYGLETGVYLTLFGASILLSLRLDRFGPSGLVGAGVVFGLTGLARLDFGVVLAGFYLLGLLRGDLGLREVLATGSAALLVVAPWLAYIYGYLGTIIPSSGIAQSRFFWEGHVVNRLQAGVEALLQVALPFLHVGAHEAVLYLGLVALVGVAIGLKRRSSVDLDELLDPVGRHWLPAMLMLAPIYVGLFWSTWFYHRYLAPLYLLFLPVVAAGLVAWVEEVGAAWRRSVATVGVGLLVVQFVGWSAAFMHLPAGVTDHAIAAGEVRAKFDPERERIGSFQSGVMGYFNPPIVNLDGKVNHAVLPYLADGRTCEYLELAQIDYVIDWGHLIRERLSEGCLEASWEPCRRRIAGDFVCLRRRGER